MTEYEPLPNRKVTKVEFYEALAEWVSKGKMSTEEMQEVITAVDALEREGAWVFTFWIRVDGKPSFFRNVKKPLGQPFRTNSSWMWEPKND